MRATTRALTYRYALALALIGSLAVTGFFILQHTIATHEASSSIISQTSQQSDLVLEVVSTARHLVESDDATVRATERATLFEAARAIEKAHRKLTDPVGPLGGRCGPRGRFRTCTSHHRSSSTTRSEPSWPTLMR